MPNPGVEHGEGFTPWFASPEMTQADKETVQAMFDACGIAREVHGEDDINYLTGLTGPIPGLFGLVASVLINAAVAKGFDHAIAERAIRFHVKVAGNEILRSDLTPAEDVARPSATAVSLPQPSAPPLTRASNPASPPSSTLPWKLRTRTGCREYRLLSPFSVMAPLDGAMTEMRD